MAVPGGRNPNVKSIGLAKKYNPILRDYDNTTETEGETLALVASQQYKPGTPNMRSYPSTAPYKAPPQTPNTIANHSP